MKLLFGVFGLHDGRLTTDNAEAFTYQNDQVQLHVLGTIRCDGSQSENNGELLARTVLQHREKLPECLRGMYLLVALDNTTNTLFIVQDSTTSPITMYYVVCGQKLYFSTSLKKLLAQTSMPRTLNMDTVDDFFCHGFINNRQTLVQDVFKIESGRILRASNNGLEQIAVAYPIPDMTEAEGVNAWCDTLDAAICRAVDGEDEAIYLPLSGGYDTNYILNAIRRKSDVKVKAFCVGGSVGRNEVPVVEQNVAEYPNIDLVTGYTDHTSIDLLPDIVWRLEGAVFETGIFLQYILAQLVKAHGGTHLVCGECADQIMNRLYFEGRKRNSTPSRKATDIYDFEEDPYYYGNMLILKKSGILMNSFDIDTHYPFLQDEFVVVARAVRAQNDRNKAFHKQQCSAMLPPKIVERLKKVPGTTDCHALLTDDMRVALHNYLKQSDIYQQYYPAHKCNERIRCYTGKDWVQSYRFLAKRTIAAVTKHQRYVEQIAQREYMAQERDMRQLLCLLYLTLFERLFLSGEYDALFDKRGLEVGLEQVIGYRLNK